MFLATIQVEQNALFFASYCMKVRTKISLLTHFIGFKQLHCNCFRRDFQEAGKSTFKKGLLPDSNPFEQILLTCNQTCTRNVVKKINHYTYRIALFIFFLVEFHSAVVVPMKVCTSL